MVRKNSQQCVEPYFEARQVIGPTECYVVVEKDVCFAVVKGNVL